MDRIILLMLILLTLGTLGYGVCRVRTLMRREALNNQIILEKSEILAHQSQEIAQKLQYAAWWSSLSWEQRDEVVDAPNAERLKWLSLTPEEWDAAMRAHIVLEMQQSSDTPQEPQ